MRRLAARGGLAGRTTRALESEKLQQLHQQDHAGNR